MGTPRRDAILAGLFAGLAAGAWIGVADATRAATLGPAPFTPEDFGRGVLVQALGGALLGIGGALLLARRLPSGRDVAIAVAHGIAFLFLAAFAAGALLPRQRATGSLALNALLALLAIAAAAAILAASARRLAARFPHPLAPGLRIALPVLPLLAAVACFAVPAGRAGPPIRRDASGRPPPNVLVVLVDTLRADRVGAAGSTLGLTPRIDAFAREGVSFTQARTSCPWTKPAVASLLTGLRPERHRMDDMASKLPPDAIPMSEHLQAAGYRTALFSDSEWTAAEFGFRRGVEGPFLHPQTGDLRGVTVWRTAAFFVDWWRDSYHRENPTTIRGAPALSRRLLEWTDRPDPRPWAAYMHWMEPHHPYAPAIPSTPGRPRVPVMDFYGTVPYDRGTELPAGRHAELLANYDDEVREVDAAFGGLIDALRTRGLLDRTFVVLTADHGEEFFEHGGWTHEHSLQDELLRVPLVMRPPGGISARPNPLDCTLEDVLPTLLDACGIPSTTRFDGRVIERFMRMGSFALADRPSCSVLHRSRAPVTLRSAVFKGLKVIKAHREGDLRESWYELRTDPGELTPLLRPAAGEAGKLLGAISDHAALESEAAGGDAALSRETREALKAFGYLGSPAPAPDREKIRTPK